MGFYTSHKKILLRMPRQEGLSSPRVEIAGRIFVSPKIDGSTWLRARIGVAARGVAVERFSFEGFLARHRDLDAVRTRTTVQACGS